MGKLIKRSTRVTVDFPRESHRTLKAVAALNDMSIQDFVRSCVEDRISEKMKTRSKAKKPNARTRKAIKDAEAGRGLKTAKDVEDLKKQLGL
jgi:antitoxin component of RelBE/YafQ-DinJ toxin-antitoxin module